MGVGEVKWLSATGTLLLDSDFSGVAVELILDPPGWREPPVFAHVVESRVDYKHQSLFPF